jgi:mannose-1-phosphate guanylyltransferase
MAGGKGERFWPMSRRKMPKQLLPIVGEDSLIAQTLARVSPLVPLSNIFVITNSEYADAIADACPALRRENIVAEPEGRDTAAAVGLGGVLAQLADPDASLAVLPSDHVIHDGAAFRDVISKAFEAAENGDWLVTIGIRPEFPATGYGYINRGAVCMKLGDLPVYKVGRFVEKPKLDVARQYVESGEYLWNAGMFVWKAGTFFHAFDAYVPDVCEGLKKIRHELEIGRPIASVLAEYYPTLRKISIDFAMMEKAQNVLTIPATFDWDDVGSWQSLEHHLPKDSNGNVTRGNALVLCGKNNIVAGSGRHLVCLMGIDDCIVVHTDDVTMVCAKAKAQNIKDLVKCVSSNPAWADRV